MKVRLEGGPGIEDLPLQCFPVDLFDTRLELLALDRLLDRRLHGDEGLNNRLEGLALTGKPNALFALLGCGAISKLLSALGDLRVNVRVPPVCGFVGSRVRNNHELNRTAFVRGRASSHLSGQSEAQNDASHDVRVPFLPLRIQRCKSVRGTIFGMDPALLIGVGAIGLVALRGGRKKRGSTASKAPSGATGTFRQPALTSHEGILLDPNTGMSGIGLDQSLWPEMAFEIPFGSGVDLPTWPLVTHHDRKFTVCYRTMYGTYEGNPSRRFMDERRIGRYHVGVDLYCRDGDPVIACENGTIVNIYHFYHGAYCILVQCDSGLVINYAEVENGSWREFGLSKGSRVQQGQGIARIGTMSGGSSMLHFETYMRPQNKNKRYHGGATGAILNPTYYLLRARAFAGRSFSGTGADYCDAQYWQHATEDPELAPLAELETELDVAPQDSVLAELNAEGKVPQRLADNADGP